MKGIVRAMVAAVLLVAGAYAQTSRGTVTGLVMDPSSAVVANATVELKNTGTGVARSTQPSEAGIYRFDAVDPGNYEISATAPGFKALKVAEFGVAAAQVASIDLKLEVGSTETVVDVTGEAAVLQIDSPVRSATIENKPIQDLPYATRNPVSIALAVPGVSTSRFGVGGQGSFSVNGTRNRSNNFLIDGMENNDISVAGQALQITLPEMIQEVSVQTSNFDAEFGRAGGAVVNVITKGGSNDFHGSAAWLLDVTNDDAITNTQGLDPAVQKRGKPLPGTENIWSGTIGGPIKRNKTFFFGAFSDDRQKSSGSATALAPTANGWAKLSSLFPQGTNPRVDLFRQVLAGSTATAQPTNIALGLAPGTGIDRGNVEFGTATVAYPNFQEIRLFSIRVDHNLSSRDQLSARYTDNYNPASPATLNWPGMGTSTFARQKNAALAETHTFSPTLTNELRLGYNRIDIFFPIDAESALAKTLPQYSIAGLTGAFGNSNTFGVISSLPQGRLANNYTLQDTVSKVMGRHTLRGGLDILRQRSRQFAPINERGSLTYNATSGNGAVYSGFANFIDDFGGTSGTASRDFGSPVYYPSLLRQQYFITDRWRFSNDLTITLGLRYENFGVPINSLKYVAFGGLFNVSPTSPYNGPWNTPSTVSPDNNNFGPSVGVAWSPSNGGALLGNKKSVIRTGYQIGYDSFYNNLASNAAVSAPNVNSQILTSVASAQNPRGMANLSANFPKPGVILPTAAQTLVIKNLVNPYYQKWSFGIQRELPSNMVMDVSYVGTKGTKLFMSEDFNPVVPASMQVFPSGYTAADFTARTGLTPQPRLDAMQGARSIRTNGGSSYYHGLQNSLTRRFKDGFSGTMTYTWSKTIDYVSDPFTTSNINVLSGSAIPTIFGGLPREKALSLFDRTHRFVITASYELPILKNRKDLAGKTLGGWQLSAFYNIESGVPYTVVNGIDADGIGGNNDRPDVNPFGTKGVRAVPGNSPTGYVNPDAGNAPIDPKTAQYIVVASNTALRTGNGGRNTERTPGRNNLDVNIFKTFAVTERWKLELRSEMYNILNHPQLGSPSVSPFSPAAGTLSSNTATGLPGRWLNPTFMDGGGRVIRYQLRILF
jgi:hypothetical protein